MSLYESGEMYLESILILTREKSDVRAIDLCEYMNYSKPSVSRALSNLKKSGHVSVDENGHISLTNDGIAVAEKIYERHNILSTVLQMIGVSEETASEDACKIEHDISDESFEAIKRLVTKNQ